MGFIKRCAKGFYMSLGMFWAVPLPFHIWDDASVDLMLPFFPLIGLFIGALWWGIAALLVLSGVHIVLLSAVLMAIPFLLTGFLHLDGYMDTSDAVLSRRPLEDKLRILKDPHTGAFAVIMIGFLFVLQFGATYAVVDGGKALLPLIFIAVVSRCCASISLLCMKIMPQSGYANMMRQNAGALHVGFVVVLLLAAAVVAYLLTGFVGLIVVGAVVLGYAGALAYSRKEFKGVSGDLAGFSLVIGELCGVIALAVV